MEFLELSPQRVARSRKTGLVFVRRQPFEPWQIKGKRVISWPSVKLGIFLLTSGVKIGYDTSMVRDVLTFVFRIGLVVGFWGFVWSFVKPRTQLLRICRALLLVLGLLGIWAVLQMAGA